MTKISVLYPNRKGARFDVRYSDAIITKLNRDFKNKKIQMNKQAIQRKFK